MSSATYQEHLASVDWQAIRADVLQRAGYRCKQCGSPYGLQVHHRTYERLGREQPDDLICLCRDCHRRAHGLRIANQRAKVDKVDSPIGNFPTR